VYYAVTSDEARRIVKAVFDLSTQA
jgi:hypothetical protein